MRVHRLIAILVVIEKEKKVKAKVLSSMLEVSVRTIYRDIDALSEAGFPIYATTGPEGGISFMEGYTLGIAGDALSIEGDNLNKKDLLSKIMSGITTIPDNASTVHSIEEGFSQLRMLLGKGEDQSSLLTERLYIDNDTWWGGGAKDPFDIRTLMDVLWQLQEIEIDYMKQAGQVTKRKLNPPYGLILKDSTWYLVAYCHNVNAIRTFRCERIARVIVKDGHYKIPEGFSLKNYWQQSIKHLPIVYQIIRSVWSHLRFLLLILTNSQKWISSGIVEIRVGWLGLPALNLLMRQK